MTEIVNSAILAANAMANVPEGKILILLIRAWDGVLEPIPDDELKPAFVAALRSRPERSATFPVTPMEVFNAWKAARAPKLATVAEAWEIAKKALRNAYVDLGIGPKIDDPIIAKVVASVGWQRLSSDESVFAKLDFERRYAEQIAAESDRAEAAHVRGLPGTGAELFKSPAVGLSDTAISRTNDRGGTKALSAIPWVDSVPENATTVKSGAQNPPKRLN